MFENKKLKYQVWVYFELLFENVDLKKVSHGECTIFAMLSFDDEYKNLWKWYIAFFALGRTIFETNISNFDLKNEYNWVQLYKFSPRTTFAINVIRW